MADPSQLAAIQRIVVRRAGILLTTAVLLAAACTSSEDAAQGTDTSDDAQGADTGAEAAMLGVVEVREGEAIQIRSLNAITADIAYLGLTNQRGVELAVADYGGIKGFDVDLGTRLDSLCSADGGQAAAQSLVADSRVVGVIGTSCSNAATAAAPLITGAAMVMIAPSNTSPALTSDLSGNPGANHNPGYFRTSHNDLYQGQAVARFLHDHLGVSKVAALHDGDTYTEGLASAFAAAFESLGGTVTAVVGINKDDTDMVPALTELAVSRPEALFFPIFQPAGDHVAAQARRVEGLESAVLVSSAGLLVDGFMELAQSAGMFFSGPDIRFARNANQSTAITAEELLDAYQQVYGEAPAAQYWGHAYDATTLLLDAISASSELVDGTLVIDRAGVRRWLYEVSGYAGITGTLECDAFGDCGSQKLTVIEHLDPEDIAASRANVVFEFSPSPDSNN